MRIRTLLATGTLALAAALAVVAPAGAASAAVAPADCIWHGGTPICVPNQ